MKIEPIGLIKTPFKEKFGIPRQGLFELKGHSHIEMHPAFSHPDFFRDLDGFSHIWVHSLLDQAKWNQQTTLRPPRLGGQKRVGLFATRGPHRPNPLGLSLVRLFDIEIKPSKVLLHTSLMDILDATPVLDIKPYIPGYDSALNAKIGWLDHVENKNLVVKLNENSQNKLRQHYIFSESFESVSQLILTVLSQDPRPGYHQKDASDKVYGLKLYDFDLQFIVQNEEVIVIDILF